MTEVSDSCNSWRSFRLPECEGPSPDRARLLAAHARSALNCDRDDDAQRTAERAVAEARELGVAEGVGGALRVAGLVAGTRPDTALLIEAVDVLRWTPAKLEHARRYFAATEIGRDGLELI